MLKTTDGEKIKTLLGRGVAQIIERDALEHMLTSGKKLRVKLGIDPTAPDLHLGHAVVLRKLKEFQDLGHKIVLIIGDFTAQIGDPSGKSKTRSPLSEADIKKNMKNFLAQAGKVIDVKKAEIRKNSEWHKKGGLKSLLELARTITVQQVLEREDFQKRMKAGENISTLETLYPLLQGYDSVAVKADVELGGTDQLFNLLMGRRVQRHFGMSEQQVMTTPLLIGLDGVHKMSKSLGNYIGLTDAPNDMFGKVMSIRDAHMREYFELCVGVSVDEFVSLQNHLSPRDLKARLASEIVKFYHGALAAKAAEERFYALHSSTPRITRIGVDTTFNKPITVTLWPELVIPKSTSVIDVVMKSGVAGSRSQAWRLVEQGGFDVNGFPMKDPREILRLENGDTVKIGKKTGFQIKIR